MKNKDLVQFIYELGVLKSIRHEGWRLIGVNDPETVAAHALRASQIAFFLAKMEGYKKPEKIVTMLVFHDIAECRVGDLHKVASRYLENNEEQVVKEQTFELGNIGRDILDYWQKFEDLTKIEGQIAKDADLLEQAVTAKEYIKLGHPAENWLKNIESCLKTESAKELFKEIELSESFCWWKGLKKV